MVKSHFFWGGSNPWLRSFGSPPCPYAASAAAFAAHAGAAGAHGCAGAMWEPSPTHPPWCPWRHCVQGRVFADGIRMNLGCTKLFRMNSGYISGCGVPMYILGSKIRTLAHVHITWIIPSSRESISSSDLRSGQTALCCNSTFWRTKS